MRKHQAHTDKELGKQLSAMGYEHKKQTKGASYRMKEKQSIKVKQVVLPSLKASLKPEEIVLLKVKQLVLL